MLEENVKVALTNYC